MILKTLACFAAGVFTWTFMEYALHNWYGHLAKGKNKFSREHLAHHANTSYFAPDLLKAMTGIVVLSCIDIFASVAIGIYYGNIYTAGITGFYIFYEILHKRIHTHAPIGFYGRWVRKHHFYHHFGSPKKNHGVTSPIWDIILKTYVKVDIVQIPERNMEKWLIDPDNGGIKPIYLNDYKLLPKRNLQEHMI